MPADVRGRFHRPHGFGVEALQGGLTLWNRQADAAGKLTAELLDIAVGSEEKPVLGSGIFVGGHGDWEGTADGGTIDVTTLRTGEVHTDGGIVPGTPDLISGGVFVITGANVEKVDSVGRVTTYGQNDMVLDNWGNVGTWTASEQVASHGPSGIGFRQLRRHRRARRPGPAPDDGQGCARVQPVRRLAQQGALREHRDDG